MGRGLLQEDIGLAVAGTDMAEQQLLGFSQGSDAAGLAGGEVLALLGKLGKLVCKCAFEAQEVGALDEGDDIFGVGRVAAVGVAAGGIGATGHLGDAEAVGGHRMDDGEGIDGATRALEDPMHSFREVHLDEIQLVAYMVAGEAEDGFNHLAGSFGSHHGDGLSTTAEVHGGEKPWKTEEVVAM